MVHLLFDIPQPLCAEGKVNWSGIVNQDTFLEK